MGARAASIVRAGKTGCSGCRIATPSPGPRQNIFNLRLSRRFYIKEKANIEFLGEAFNLPNTLLVTGVNSTMYNLISGSLNFNAPFGTVTSADSTLFRERQITRNPIPVLKTEN